MKKLFFIPLFLIFLFLGFFLLNQKNHVNYKSQDNSQINNNELSKSVDTIVDNSSKKLPLIYNDKSIPVLMYHSIPTTKGNELELPKHIFERHMLFLKSNGYTTLKLDELYNFLVYNQPVPEKSIVITLDDGYVDNYLNAYPILKKYGLNATIFVITDLVDKNKNYLTSTQLKEMSDYGLDIQSHTVNHDDLSKIPYDKQIHTLKESKKFLENLLNKDIRYMAYPFGRWNADTLKAVKDSGYIMGFSTNGTWANISNGIYTLNRVYISSNFDMNEFKNRICNINYK